MSQKDDDWKRACVDFFIGSSYIGRYNGRTISERQQINYELYNSRFNRKDLEYVTNPFGVDEEQSFPANIQNFNIIRPKIDLLLGEEIKRPFNWRVIQTNPEATSRIERQKRDMLLQYVMGEISKEINLKAQAQQLQQKQQQQQGQGGQQQGGQPNIGGAGPNVPSETLTVWLPSKFNAPFEPPVPEDTPADVIKEMFSAAVAFLPHPELSVSVVPDVSFMS